MAQIVLAQIVSVSFRFGLQCQSGRLGLGGNGPKAALSELRLPKPPSPMTLAAVQTVQSILDGPASAEKLNRALRYLAKWRTEVLANTLVAKDGPAVHSGPFKGMIYDVPPSEGTRSARLLGTYEASLHPVIEAIIARSPDLVIDIGSAEGYYAVGMALRLPNARILARDASPKAQNLCSQLARANKVETRVEVGGLFDHADFDQCKTTRSVVICDIEGAEDVLLDPVAAPGLLHTDILVECHPGMAKDVTARLIARFSASHSITQLNRHVDDTGLPAWMETCSDLDRLIALWEWRAGPTPWLWMEQK